MTSAATPPPNVELSCPRCETRLYFPREEVGKQVRCEMCGMEFRLPEYLAAPKFEPKKVPVEPYRVMADDEAIVQVEHVSFDCERCFTRLSAPAGQAGQKMSCPVCGKIAVIPHPAKRDEPRPKPEPYPVQPEGAPPPPPVEYISTYCSKCWLLLNARRDELDKPIVCPDCGTENAVPPIWRKPPAAPPPVPETYRVLAEDEAIVQEELILVDCYRCHARIHVPVAEAGKTVACPDCKTSLTVPAWQPKAAAALPEPTTYRILGDDEDWKAPTAAKATGSAVAAGEKPHDAFSLVGDDELAPSAPSNAPSGAAVRQGSTPAPTATSSPAADDLPPISLSRPPEFVRPQAAPSANETLASPSKDDAPQPAARRPPTSAIDPLDEIDSGPPAQTIDVFCPKCGARMRARLDQLGQMIACPKCGATTEAKVGSPPSPSLVASAPASTPPGPPFGR
ncbi:MAG: hypothetical protein HYS13_07800, partial [Planctomycetia bacterium]|nr:hypothetical protein [Planctomycetia bacterium]